MEGVAKGKVLGGQGSLPSERMSPMELPLKEKTSEESGYRIIKRQEEMLKSLESKKERNRKVRDMGGRRGRRALKPSA